MKTQTKPLTVEGISASIIDHLRDQFFGGRDDLTGEELETVRCGIGLSLSAIHSVLLHNAKGEEAQRDAVNQCFHSVDNILRSLKGAVEEADLDIDVQIEECSMHEPGPETH